MSVMMMKLRITYGSEKDALTVYSSVRPDDDDYVFTVLDGCDVLFEFRAESAGQMRSAMDDVLACVKVSEEALGLVSGSGPDLDGDSLSE